MSSQDCVSLTKEAWDFIFATVCTNNIKHGTEDFCCQEYQKYLNSGKTPPPPNKMDRDELYRYLEKNPQLGPLRYHLVGLDYPRISI